MAEEDRGKELPQRAGGGPPPVAPASSPLPSEEMRQRTGTDDRTGTTASQPERAANAGPVAEDDVTEWLGSAKPPSAAEPSPAVKPSPALKPSPAEKAGTAVRPSSATRSRAVSRPRAAPRTRGRPGARLAVRVVIVILVIGALAVAAVRHFARAPRSGPASAAVARQEAAVRNEAATWVARQVSRGVLVSCDRVMCAALTAHGFPPHDLLVLGPTSNYPVSSAVVVETAAVQDLFGSSLATAWAPAVLASFGSGPAAIIVRVIAPHGAAAYQTMLNADLAARKTAGAALLNDPRITVPGPAGSRLTAGQVDSRLLRALAALAGHQPISIVQFGNDSLGASSGVPLRFADLAETSRAAHLARAAYVRSVRAYLNTLNIKFRPAAMTTVVLADGQAVLRVEFTAPSPLGVFGPQGSS
jgi:hypothetical protein